MSGRSECVVFLTGEGPNDIGRFAREPQYQQNRRSERRRSSEGDGGLIPPLLRKIAREVGIDLRLEGRKLIHLKKGATTKNALTARARAAVALARTYDAQVVVIVHDTDRERATPRSDDARSRRMNDVRAAILAGLDAPEAGREALPTLVATPCRMIEAWALGDPAAVAKHTRGDDPRPVPDEPEALWGDKHDPNSDYPKHVLNRCLGHQYSREELEQIAEAADLDVMAKRCPESFAPFLERARGVAYECADRLKS